MKSSGNKFIDEDTEGKMQLLRDIIIICMDDLSYVQVLYNKLRERQQAGVADTTLPFKDTKVLKDLDKDFLLNFVTSRSDLHLAQAVMALEHDRDSILQLVMYETQLPLSLKWFPLRQSHEVTSRVLCDRGDKCGKRLANFKASGGYANSMLKWSVGVYKPNFSKQGGEKARLESITHVPARCKKTVVESIIFFKNALAIGENWSDTSACLLTPPLPPVKCIGFFDEALREGPYNVMLVTKKKAPFEHVSRSSMTSTRRIGGVLRRPAPPARRRRRRPSRS